MLYVDAELLGVFEFVELAEVLAAGSVLPKHWGCDHSAYFDGIAAILDGKCAGVVIVLKTCVKSVELVLLEAEKIIVV